jgi:two-component system LytT family response regulator
MLNAVIIEDEKKSREVLRKLIHDYCPDVHISGMAESVSEGIELIRNEKPDLVFLDIEMQSGSGFDLLEKIGKVNFDVIFTTAYEQYALKAIKFSALDYLLKPIDIGELKAAVEKIILRNDRQNENEKVSQLIRNFNHKLQPKITLSTSDGLVFILVEDIIRCEAQGAYTVFYFKNRKSIMVSKNLKEFQILLEDYQFFRIHNSHLINLNEIEKYKKADGGSVLMSDGSTISISESRRQEFLNLIRE